MLQSITKIYFQFLNSGVRDYICPICKKGFNQPHVLRTHLRTHPGAVIPPPGVVLSQKALSRVAKSFLNDTTVDAKP